MATLMANPWLRSRVAQGGEGVSGVTHALAASRAPGLIAAHVNGQFVFPKACREFSHARQRKANRSKNMKRALFANDQSGYFPRTGPRPQPFSTSSYRPSGHAGGLREVAGETDNNGILKMSSPSNSMPTDQSLLAHRQPAASSATPLTGRNPTRLQAALSRRTDRIGQCRVGLSARDFCHAKGLG